MTYIPEVWKNLLTEKQWLDQEALHLKKVQMQQKTNKVSTFNREQYKKLLNLNDLQRQVIVGLALGDGHLCLAKSCKHYSLMVEQSKLEYVMFLYEIFKPWVLTPPFKTPAKETYRFQTLSHVAFDFYGKMFYEGKTKVLPVNLHRFLSEPALAIWFMDDGSRKGANRMGVNLNTQCFSLVEHNLLIQSLRRVGLESTAHKQVEGSGEVQYRLYLNGDAEMALRSHISVYILPCFIYKLPAITVKKYLKAPYINN